jgi:hypothetical protein
LRGVEGRPQNRVECFLELLLGLLEKRSDAEDPGAVDKHVDAPEAIDGGVDQLRGGLGRAHVAGDERDAIVGIELAPGGLEHLQTATRENHGGSQVEEACRGSPADPATAAGNDDHPSLELGHASLL